MATLDKLVKTVESLRLYQSPAISMDQNLSKKEKMSHCNMVADNVCSQAGAKNNADFSKYLTVATDMFFTLSNDEDADIRLLADECLTKVVKNLSESGNNVGRMQVELYKEIKKNGSSRSLRSAVTKFAAVCGQIRPQKCRAYIENLTPCLAKIAQTRKEEAVHETLAENLNSILDCLGHYASDIEIDQLLNAFLINLTESSASIRRSTASILASICAKSRKPANFSFWLFKTIIGSVVPCTGDPQSIPADKVLGIMVGTRAIIPLISKYEEQLEIDASDILQKSLQLYELCLCLMESKNTSIIMQSLETLQQLLKTPSNIFKQMITSPQGITSSNIKLEEKEKDSDDVILEEETKSEDVLEESLNKASEDSQLLQENEESLHSAAASLERGRIKLMDSMDVASPRPSESENPNYTG